MGPSRVSTRSATATSDTSVEALVRNASQRAPHAFDELVVRFQDMAVGTAYGWLRDLGQAEDAAQEAFVEVFRNLDRLEEPAAFPGFLRRVVLKHCDRRTRGVRVEVVLGDPGAGAEAPAPIADTSLSAAEDRARVRAAVEELPAAERGVVALHYLAGLTQTEVANWLELPLTTVKKRLHTARGRLRDEMERMMEETFESMRPSRNSSFSDTIRLFLAIREGDVECVRTLLERSPELAESEERWDGELSRAHALPIPNGGTPLVRAAERNQVELVDLLLDRGAEIDRACPCAGGESPLWAAVANGQLEATVRLLKRGADPDHASFAEHTPLHVAALRGFERIAEVLCEHGADGARRDARGRTPADWARIKGHDGIAVRLERRFGAPAQREARPPASGLGETSFATGLKAIDLFVPFFPGSRTRVRFDSGLGVVVFLSELSTRWSLRFAPEGLPGVVWVGWERQRVDLSEMEHAFAELDLHAHVRLVWSAASDAEDERRETLARAIREARQLKQGGALHPLVIVFAQPGRRAEIEAGLPGLEGFTAIVAERYGDPAADEGPVPPPFDSRLAFDPALAAIGHFPALHPLKSVCGGLTPERVGERHCRIATRARELLAAHRRIVPDLQDGDAATQSAEEAKTVARARRLQAFLTQPFQVAESFTGEPARGLSLAETLDDVERVLEGDLDGTPLGRVPYKGRLSEILESEAGPQTAR